MSLNLYPPLPASSYRSLTSVSDPLTSSNHLFNLSKAPRDYRERTRIEFPGGWNHASDEIFQWYHSQPNKRFQEIEYCKQKTGVQHEFIRVLLQNDQGDRVPAFCRIERVADIERRIEAITRQGTIAVDLVHTIDPSNPIEPDLADPPASKDDDLEVVARITFPRPLDLRNLLSICYGIHQHPQARSYTLQQFNCYFFSWTIILCLARHTVDFADLIRDGTETLKRNILEHIGDLRSSGKITLWFILFQVGDRQTSEMSQNQPHIIRELLAEVASKIFLDAVSNVFLPCLWHHQSRTILQTGLQSRLDGVAQKAADPLLQDSLVNPQRKVKFARLLWEIITLSAHQSEFIRLCTCYWIGFDEAIQVTTDQHIKSRSALLISKQPYHKVFYLRIRVVLTQIFISIISLLFMFPLSIFILNLRYTYDSQISFYRRERRTLWKGVPTFLAMAQTALRVPYCLYQTVMYFYRSFLADYYKTLIETAIALDWCQEEDLPEKLSTAHKQEKGLRVLDRCLDAYQSRHVAIHSNDLRKVALKAIRYFCEVRSEHFGVEQHSMDELWKLSFRGEIGAMLAQAILALIEHPMDDSRSFLWIPGHTAHVSLPKSENTLLSLSHADLQARIRERIASLTRWEVEGAPISPYMRHVAFAIPAKESQEQIESAIESIWGICGPLMA